MNTPQAVDCHIPTSKMRKLKRLDSESNRLTTYYEDTGQLYWWFGRGVETTTAYFIQGDDRETAVVIEPGDKRYTDVAIAQHLDANMTADVIKCRVPTHMAHHYEHTELGVKLFLTQFHPSACTRDLLGSFLWGSHFHTIVFN